MKTLKRVEGPVIVTDEMLEQADFRAFSTQYDLWALLNSPTMEVKTDEIIQELGKDDDAGFETPSLYFRSET